MLCQYCKIKNQTHPFPFWSLYKDGYNSQLLALAGSSVSFRIFPPELGNLLKWWKRGNLGSPWAFKSMFELSYHSKSTDSWTFLDVHIFLNWVEVVLILLEDCAEITLALGVHWTSYQVLTGSHMHPRVPSGWKEFLHTPRAFDLWESSALLAWEACLVPREPCPN